MRLGDGGMCPQMHSSPSRYSLRRTLNLLTLPEVGLQ